mmetsp:Transcript_21935/g.24965  ORF Transcript_21935/g.24965 Transcript_21935/m.24965 type:complete len:619 (+) Transcript_21935:174-2030(+)
MSKLQDAIETEEEVDKLISSQSTDSDDGSEEETTHLEEDMRLRVDIENNGIRSKEENGHVMKRAKNGKSKADIIEEADLIIDRERKPNYWKRRRDACFLLLALVVASIVIAAINQSQHQKSPLTVSSVFPKELIGKNGAYSHSDFVSKKGISVPYWDDVIAKPLTKRIDVTLYNNDKLVIPHLGPCYLPEFQSDMNEIDWKNLMEEHRNLTSPSRLKYPDAVPTPSRLYDNQPNLANSCRPGFIIIGAGKCGTSSLYHYLVDHPRVLPAKEKQIHYFKYFTNRPMSWYLSHFPTSQSFLSNGALMTGEASPGYLPYPDVARRLQVYMKNNAGNGENQPVDMPKIITIVRNPLERSWSSYNYNYVRPTVSKMKNRYYISRKNKKSIHSKDLTNMTDAEIVDKYFFSFEQMVKAELELLKECLKPGGDGEMGAKKLYGTKRWAKPLFASRDNEKGVPLVTLDESCYGEPISSDVPRKQWKELVEKYPEKWINVPNLHLVQSIVGRSLYTLPLEWWYALYPKEDLYLVCNEDLKYRPSQTMSEVSDFLGLPTFDFSDVVSEGMYNVGENTGYDTASEWDKTDKKTHFDEIPISAKLREEYLSFVKPYSERLFEIAGKRCDW